MANQQQPRRRTRRARTLAEKLSPIPAEFYDDKLDEDLIAPRSVLFPFTVFLNLSGIAAFAAFCWYYSNVESTFLQESTIQGEYDYSTSGPSWNCTPVMSDPYYRTRMNYATCKAMWQMPSEANVDADADDESGRVLRYNYYPFAGFLNAGIVLPHHEADKSYERADLSSFNAYYKRIFDPLKSVNSCKSRGLKRGSSGDDFTSPDFGEWLVLSDDDKNLPFRVYAEQMKPLDSPRAVQCCAVGDGCNPHDCDNFQDSTVFPSGDPDTPPWRWETSESCPKCCQDGAANVLSDCAQGENNFFRIFPGADRFGYPYAGYDESGDNRDVVTSLLDFDRCTITKAEAIRMFTKYVELHDYCAFAKYNAPFTCERLVPRKTLEIFSLSFSNALLVYSLFSSVCVKLFLSKAKRKDGNDDGNDSDGFKMKETA